MIRFTNHQKDKLAKWMRQRTQKSPRIRGMDRLYEQITRDDKVNYNRDKDGFFFQAQITRQLDESGKYDITRIEDKGIIYDIDIELDGYICLQAWFGGNIAGHLLDREVARSNLPLVLYSQRTCLDRDLDVRQHKLDQTNKPTLDGGVLELNPYTLHAQHPLCSQAVRYPYAMTMPNARSDTYPVKILVTMSSTRLPLHFLPEWDLFLKDRTIIELRGGFDNEDNLRGAATLHRFSRQWDRVARRVVDALGFRYVESFNTMGAGRQSMRFGGLLAGAWQSSYLNTASQRIRLQPKVMASVLDPDFVKGYLIDSGYAPSPTFIRNYINDKFGCEISQVIWAEVEPPDQSAPFMPDADRMESVDRLIANQALARDSHQPGLYNLYGGEIDRDKTATFDATVIDVGGNDLELHHVVELLYGIMRRSKKIPDCFLGDPVALSTMTELGRACGCAGVKVIPYNGTHVQVPTFMGIPVWEDYCVWPNYKRGCIYAINREDELGARGGLRLLESSLHKDVELQCWPTNECMAYVVGETAVDPRACGKMVNIRERW